MISNWVGLVWSNAPVHTLRGQAKFGQDLFVGDSFAAILLEPCIGAIQRLFFFCTQRFVIDRISSNRERHNPIPPHASRESAAAYLRTSPSASGLPGPKCLRITSGSVSLRLVIATPRRAASAVTNNSSLVNSPKRISAGV